MGGFFLGLQRHLCFALPWVRVVPALGVREVRTGHCRVTSVFLLVSPSIERLGSFRWDVLSVIVLRESSRSVRLTRAFHCSGRTGSD